ncbi:biogenesis of lysosome-related organelles complex 1 subunit 2 isoform X1 [Anoplophora glabripennis]|uniref:biogenesis of lysosome-related organelles complex 1 subunit 2 isoform X1 n=1 Tax=Anoplophora glabripennis TaxID=217634 RepID=UPI000874AA49|nr:biogenesis of lysosome-related organelles complex 1 subunit 2 isoform X1 [Anoplophora glabripennis]
MTDEGESDGVTDSPKRGKIGTYNYSKYLSLYILGPTLSTSTSSFEALDPHDPNLSKLANTMFSKTSEYLYGELTSTLDDYRLLENMNQATITKYSDMKHLAVNINKSLSELNDKYNSLIPLLQQIDQIEDSVVKLEQAAYKLDAYSKRLEAKFKNLEKR